MLRRLKLNLGIVLEILVNVLKRGWGRHRLQYAEAEPMGLIRVEVRVLANYHHLD